MANSVDVTRVRQAVQDFAVERATAIGEAFVETVKGYAPRRTGTLADSVEMSDVQVHSAGVRITITVASPYGRFQNDGTGIYGPSGQPITPKRVGGVLVFDSAIGGGIVFARSVRGTEPTHFWERAVDQWPRIVAEAGR